jgi:hypothetical protein
MSKKASIPLVLSGEKSNSLTDTVFNVLYGIWRHKCTIGVFYINKKFVMLRADGVRYLSFISKRKEQWVGAYGKGIDVQNLIDDLKEFCDE